VNRVCPSTKVVTNSIPQIDEGGVEGDGDADGSEGTEVQGDGNGHESINTARSGPSISGPYMKSFEDVEVDDNHSEFGRSDVLLSPPINDEEDIDRISSHPSVEFHEIDLPNLTLKLKMKLFSIQLFREAVREGTEVQGDGNGDESINTNARRVLTLLGVGHLYLAPT